MAKHKTQEGFWGLQAPSPESALTVGGVAADVLMKGTAGQATSATIQTAQMVLQNSEQELAAQKLLQEGRSTIRTDSPAFKKYIDDLANSYTTQIPMMGVSIAGSVAGAAVGASLLPGGWVAGIAGGMAGGMGATMVAEKLFVAKKEDLMEFATRLQQSGEQQQLPEEAALVAFTWGMNKQDMKTVTSAVGVRDVSAMVKLLETDEGRFRLQNAIENSEVNKIIMAKTGLIQQPGQPINAIKQFTALVNSGYLSGVDLFKSERLFNAANFINAQNLQAQYVAPEADMITPPRTPQQLGKGQSVAV